MPWQRRLLGRSIVALALVAAADHLFFHRGVGASAGVFGLLVVVAITLTALPGVSGRVALATALLVPMTLLILVEEPTPLALLLAAGALATLALESRQRPAGSPLRWATRTAVFAAFGSVQTLTDAARLARASGRSRSSAGLRGAVRRWGPPLLLTGVFLVLLLVANAVLARWVRSWSDVALRFLSHVDRGRFGLWVATAVVAWALLRTRARVPRMVDAHSPVPRLPSDTGFAVRSLALFNGLFLVQNAVDLRYLWLGGTLPEGMTYAEYAHRGAYPLVAAALLAAAFVLATFRSGSDREVRRLPRALVHLFLLQNVFLTVCAAERLRLYVDAYDLTRWRVAAAAWMLLVAVGLLLIVVRIAAKRDNRWLLRANARALVGVLLLCAAVNVDGLIADHNVAECREAGGGGLPVDLAYLDELGEDALPALDRLARQSRDAEVGAAVALRAATLRRTLEERVSDWRTWTFRRARLLRAVHAR